MSMVFVIPHSDSSQLSLWNLIKSNKVSFVSLFEYSQSGFPPFLSCEMVTNHDEYGGQSGQIISEQQVTAGQVTAFTFRVKIVIPDDKQTLELQIRLFTDPKRVPAKQIVILEYDIIKK